LVLTLFASHAAWYVIADGADFRDRLWCGSLIVIAGGDCHDALAREAVRLVGEGRP
jgi:hypothetical protein